ncbi:hypothetical protein BJX64DRAFT_192980 [Aspergillus heterothallicus]
MWVGRFLVSCLVWILLSASSQLRAWLQASRGPCSLFLVVPLFEVLRSGVIVMRLLVTGRSTGNDCSSDAILWALAAIGYPGSSSHSLESYLVGTIHSRSRSKPGPSPRRYHHILRLFYLDHSPWQFAPFILWYLHSLGMFPLRQFPRFHARSHKMGTWELLEPGALNNQLIL